MSWRDQYAKALPKLLSDASIGDANRQLFADFFAFEEYKLKRCNGLPDLDEGCCKTLYGYILRLRNVERWFGGKPWADLTKDDVRRVYDGLEDGTIRTQGGRPFQDRASYYNKVFKSKPFKLAGKDVLAREVIEFSTTTKQPVRYVTEGSFRSLVARVTNPRHLLLLWLAWDIGENIGTLLKLSPKDVIPQVNRSTGEREYLVHLPQDKLKRSRRSRGEITLYPETAAYLDHALARTDPSGSLFTFGHRFASKVLEAAVKRSGAATMPLGEHVRWKDLRSGMACHLLTHGWTRDEVNARLGHAPSSKTLDAYINFLAIDRAGPKQRLAATAGTSVGAASVGTAAPDRLMAARLAQAQEEIARLQRQVLAMSQFTRPVP